MTPFLAYGEYKPIGSPVVSTANPYNLFADPQGPLAFIPSDCLAVNSYQVPKVDSPIIAVVGEYNVATYMMQSYLYALFELQ